MDNAYRCEEVIPVCEDEAKRELQDIYFYLERLEEFIVVERDREINELVKYEHKWPTEKLGGFWEWNYPVHWDEVFVKQLRSCFVVSLMSFVEANIKFVIEHICKVAHVELEQKTLNSYFFKNLRKVLVGKCGFLRPSQDVWGSIGNIQKIRHCLVHHGGRIYSAGGNKERELKRLIDKLPGLSEQYGIIELDSTFPVYAFDVVKMFLKEFYGESLALCKRSPNG